MNRSHTYLRMSFLLKKVQSCKGKTHTQSLASPRLLFPWGPHRRGLGQKAHCCPSRPAPAKSSCLSKLLTWPRALCAWCWGVCSRAGGEVRDRCPAGQQGEGLGDKSGVRAAGRQLQGCAIHTECPVALRAVHAVAEGSSPCRDESPRTTGGETPAHTWDLKPQE